MNDDDTKGAPQGKGGIGALALFQAGDGPGAWKKLQALGDRVREPDHIDEAREVAALTMKAARASLETIVQRLKETGYRFAWPDGVLLPPPKDIEAKLDELEAEVGALPLSLRAAITHIGEFNLLGDHPSWPKTANLRLRPPPSESDVWFTDPLALGSIELMLDDAIEGGVRDAVTFSGDDYTKAAYSGGIYQMRTPCLAADAVIKGHTKGLTFVEHLRIGLQNGGFAGFAGLADAPRDYIDGLVKGCAIF